MPRSRRDWASLSCATTSATSMDISQPTAETASVTTSPLSRTSRYSPRTYQLIEARPAQIPLFALHSRTRSRSRFGEALRRFRRRHSVPAVEVVRQGLVDPFAVQCGIPTVVLNRHQGLV